MKTNQSIIYNGFSEIEVVPFTEEYLDLVFKWRNDPDIKKWFFNKKKIKMCDHIYWYFFTYMDREDDFIWIIKYKDIPVGMLSLYNISLENKTAEFGRLMIGDDKYRRRGIALKATQMILEYAYDVLGLNNIYLKVYTNNSKAINLYKKCGFKSGEINKDTLIMTKDYA